MQIRSGLRFFVAALFLLLSLKFELASYAMPLNSYVAPSQSETVSLLNSSQFVELDRRFSELQMAYKKGAITDDALRDDFHAFFSTDPELEAKYAQWVQQMPKSYVAHLARGIYFKKLGAQSRGSKMMSETSDEQIRRMKSFFAKARPELNISMTLDSKPILSYLHELDIDNFLGEDDEVHKQLELSIKADPVNIVVRRAYMETLETRWGGDPDKMLEFLAACKKSGVSIINLKSLESLVYQDKAWVYRYQEANVDAAVLNYKKAAALDPKGGCLTCAAETLMNAARYAEAIPIYSKVLDKTPNDAGGFYNRGYCYAKLGQLKKANGDFLHAAELGDAVAQTVVAQRYLLGMGFHQNRDEAIVWLEKAAAQGYEPAQKLLPIAKNKSIPILRDPNEH